MRCGALMNAVTDECSNPLIICTYHDQVPACQKYLDDQSHLLHMVETETYNTPHYLINLWTFCLTLPEIFFWKHLGGL
jgi:hypothetical protein